MSQGRVFWGFNVAVRSDHSQWVTADHEFCLPCCSLLQKGDLLESLHTFNIRTPQQIPLLEKLRVLLDPLVDEALIDWGMSRTARPAEGKDKHSKIVSADILQLTYILFHHCSVMEQDIRELKNINWLIVKQDSNANLFQIPRFEIAV